MTCKALPRDHHPVRQRCRQVAPCSIPSTRSQEFPILINPPDLRKWAAGNNGIAGVIEREGAKNGPEVTIVSLVHGNEFAGALAVDHLLKEDLRPAGGVLRFVFANLEAFGRFDRANPTQSRYVNEDLNRVWSCERLSEAADSAEMSRAQELLPIIQRSDLLLDLHSVLWNSAPLFITPPTPRSISLAGTLSTFDCHPCLSLTDLGHAGGARLIEHERFTMPSGKARSVLLEAGQHWHPDTVETSLRAIRHFVSMSKNMCARLNHRAEASPYHARVTNNVVARSTRFRFTKPYRGGDIVTKAGTVIATDGDDEICTPYDQCVLIMPNLDTRRGQLAVRLARVVHPRTQPG